MKKINKFLNYLILAVLVIFGGFYFYNKKMYLVANKVEENPATDVDQVVNKFLKQTSDQAIKDEMAFKAALQKQLNATLSIKKAAKVSEPVNDFSQEQPEKEDLSNSSPSETIQQGIYQKQFEKQQEELDKKEYARQFIENARKNGFHLVLSEDNKVLSVTPIRKPSQNDETESFPAD